MRSPYLLILSLVGVLLAGSLSEAVSAMAAWHQDQLVEKAEAIAIVEIINVEMSKVTGTLLFEGKERPTSLLIYQSAVQEKLYGEIAGEPIIVQYDGGGCVNALGKGRYLLFLKKQGFLFSPLMWFRIEGDTVWWYKKRFVIGDYGPEMAELPLEEALRDVKGLIKQFKKEGR